jgi:hypothetical protein
MRKLKGTAGGDEAQAMRHVQHCRVGRRLSLSFEYCQPGSEHDVPFRKLELEHQWMFS